MCSDKDVVRQRDKSDMRKKKKRWRIKSYSDNTCLHTMDTIFLHLDFDKDFARYRYIYAMIMNIGYAYLLSSPLFSVSVLISISISFSTIYLEKTKGIQSPFTVY